MRAVLRGWQPLEGGRRCRQAWPGSHRLPQASARSCHRQALPEGPRGYGRGGGSAHPFARSDAPLPALSRRLPSHASVAPLLGPAPGAPSPPIFGWGSGGPRGVQGDRRRRWTGLGVPLCRFRTPPLSVLCRSVLGSPTRCSGPGPLGVRGLVPQGSHRDSGSPLTLGLARAGSGWDESRRPVGRLSVSSALEGVTPPHGDWDGVLRPSRSVRSERCGVASRVLPVRKRPRCPFFQMLVQLG